MMESLIGATPKIDWGSGDLPGTWNKFKSHTEFMFNGPLKEKTEEEQEAHGPHRSPEKIVLIQ